eukprot:gb/GEZN01027510.1/.p1 GENE.gb/GEZN01027510.1/~~gb/GEZN01027510.1/.p1  ORF type:complete len:157 (-),score=23.54 gb/GEZN01027510.1/:29-445(-)
MESSRALKLTAAVVLGASVVLLSYKLATAQPKIKCSSCSGQEKRRRCPTKKQSNKTKSIVGGDLVTRTFKVGGMRSGACADTITDSLEYDVVSTRVDIQQETVQVTYDGAHTTTPKIITKIAEVGYEVIAGFDDSHLS